MWPGKVKFVIPPERWQSAIDRLADDITDWSESVSWKVERVPTPHSETQEGWDDDEPPFEYIAPDLKIRTPFGLLRLEIQFSSLQNAAGRADIYANSTYYRVRLLGRDEEGALWEIVMDNGVRVRQWNKETFLNISRDLLQAE